MNFALSDEQMLLREAARGALSRHTLDPLRAETDDALPSAAAELRAHGRGKVVQVLGFSAA